jgi:hypothetical protein
MTQNKQLDNTLVAGAKRGEYGFVDISLRGFQKRHPARYRYCILKLPECDPSIQ